MVLLRAGLTLTPVRELGLGAVITSGGPGSQTGQERAGHNVLCDLEELLSVGALSVVGASVRSGGVRTGLGRSLAPSGEVVVVDRHDKSIPHTGVPLFCVRVALFWLLG